MNKEKPRVGIGIIIENKDGTVLIGKRAGSHAPKHSIPGGNLKLGETFEHAAIREVKEETDLDIKNPKVIAVTNNLETYREEAIHSISVVLYTKIYDGKPKVMEPEKCEAWGWYDPNDLPEPHFDASRLSIACYINQELYIGISQ